MNFKPSHIKTLGIILASLILVYGLQIWLNYRPDAGINLPLELSKIDANRIDEINIYNEDNRLVFRKEKGSWNIKGKKVSGEFLNIWKSLEELKGSQIVSEEKSSHAAYGVGEGQGKRLLFIRNGAVITELIFGNTIGINGAYMRLGNSNAVYEVEGALTLEVARPEVEWLDKKPANAKSNKINNPTAPATVLPK